MPNNEAPRKPSSQARRRSHRQNSERYAHCLVEEAGGLLAARDFDIKLSRLLSAPAEAYRRERFDHTYNWPLGWGLVRPGRTFESTVGNRAWRQKSPCRRDGVDSDSGAAIVHGGLAGAQPDPAGHLARSRDLGDTIAREIERVDERAARASHRSTPERGDGRLIRDRR